ncbi:hypothetical protein RMATCC62417_01893 [Rhizopus microsporus]|nr:hypothetical protein RMATCC62417_01893 [Rhizopus microsporus]
MLDRLVMKKKSHAGMEVVGVPHSGLTMQVMTADRLRQYITRISRGKELNIPCNIEKFGAEVLPVLVQAWQVKQKIARTRELSVTSANNEEKEDSSWLDTCLKGDGTTLVIPLTADIP